MRCRDADEIVRFLDGRASGREADEFEDHVDRCIDCRALVTELGRALEVDETGDDELGWVARSGAELVDRGARVGRYVVVEPIGAGAMGVVYRAYDPQLDRDVALKLVRVLADEVSPERGRLRLVREAQAMAKLAHPNVVAVYDASAVGAHVFVAMERVAGVDLATWLASEPRAWRAIAAQFVQAGRGLAAAHRAGIIHRDFKPSNVLVGTDGRVRVTDFGLAELAQGTPESIAGTPAYMSPEVAAGRPADERSDQYSFAIALHEAVSGVRSGEVTRAPAPLRGALQRALADSPEARFASMDAVVDALARAVSPPLRRALPVAGLALALAGTYAGYRLAPAGDGPSCEPLSLVAIWDAPRKAEIEHAFRTSGLASAGDSWRRVASNLDTAAAALQRDHAAACARGDDLRQACLQTELARFDAVSAMFARADASVVNRAIGASELADRIAACARITGAPLPPDPVTRVKLAVATAELARIEVASARGRYAEAAAGAQRIADEAVRIGDARLESAALISLGESRWRGGDLATAEQVLHRGIDAAKRAHAVDLEAGALLTLVAVLGWEAGRYDEALRIARLAESTIAAVGDNERLGKLLANRGAISYARGDLASARADFVRAHDLLVKALGPEDRRVGQAVMNLAMIEAEPADTASLERALPLYGRALAIAEAKLGPRHPEVALTVANRAVSYANLGRYEEAVGDIERALAIRREQLGPDHRDVAQTMALLGAIELDRGRHEAALARYREALVIYHRSLRPDHPELAAVHGAIGRALLGLGREVDAIEPLERALELYAAAKIDNILVGESRFALARALWTRDQRRARTLLADARRGFRTHPEDLAKLDAWAKAHP